MAEEVDDELSPADAGDSEGREEQARLIASQAPASPVNLDGTPIQPAPPAGAPQAQPQLTSVSVSRQGIPGGAKRVGDIFDQAHAKADAESQPYVDEYKREGDALSRDYAELGKTEADKGEKTRDYYAKQTELYQRQDDFYRTQADLEREAAAKADADAAQYVGAYKEQLAGVRQLMQQSGDPLGNLTMGQSAGLVFANFAQGFLAARGIKIDVAGQVDRWVDRKIREHQMDIENARGLAQDQLHLYEIARQSSQDQYEARQRYRGMVIEASKQSVLANAARFQSDIAMTQAKEAAAHLDIEAQKTASDLTERRRNAVHQTEMMYIQEAAEKGKLEIQREELALKRQANANKPGTGLMYIPDPEKRVVTGEDGKQHTVQVLPKIVDPRLPKEVQQKWYDKALEASESEGDYQDKLTRLIKAREALDNSGGWEYSARLGRKVFNTNSAEWQEYDSARTDFVNNKIYKLSGKAINESEFERYFGLVPNQGVFNKGDTKKLLYTMQEVGRKEFQRTMDNPVFIDNPDTLDGVDAKGKPITVKNPNKMRIIGDAEPGLAATGRAFASADAGEGVAPDAVMEDLKAAEASTTSTTKASRAYKALMGGADEQTLDTTAVEDIVRAIYKPGKYRVESEFGHRVMPADNATLNHEATQALAGLAREPTPSGMYARQWLYLMQNHPEEVSKLLE